MTSLISPSLYRTLAEGALLVTANRRLARAFSTAYNELKIQQGETSWPTPGVIPLDAWLQSLHADLQANDCISTRLLSEEQEHALWINSIEESGEQSALLSVQATARELMKSWRIEHAFSTTSSPWSHFLTEDQRAYQRWSARFKEFCADAGFIDVARLPQHVFDTLAGFISSPGEHAQKLNLLPQQLVITGFTQLTPQIQSVLDCCTQLGVEILPEYTPEPVQGHAVRTRCLETEHELLSAALWARHSMQNLAQTATTAVVIADLHLRRAEVERVFDSVFFPGAMPLDIQRHGRPYELSLGQPLSNFAPVASALQILDLGFDQLSGTAITDFLRSPYLKHAQSEKDTRSRFDAKLKTRGMRTARLHALIDVETPKKLSDLLSQMQRKSTLAPAVPSVWLDRMVAMLEAAGWPGETPPQSVEYQAIEAWHDCVEEVAQLDELVGKVNASRMLNLVRNLTESRVFQPQSPALPIQIMGTLESAGLLFDALWLTGFDNESWPQIQRPNAFLPMKWQKEVMAPGASLDNEISVSRSLVAQFQSAAAKVVFSFPAVRDGNEVDVTRQLAHLPERPVAELTGDQSEKAVYRVFDSLECEAVEDYSGPAVDAAVPVRGGTRLFEDQAQCPFRAFALHRLHSRPLEEPTLGIDVRDKGNFFHDTMELFWSQTGSQEKLLALSEDALVLRIRECIEKAMAEQTRTSNGQSRSTLLKIERDRLEQVTRDWIRYFESTRAPFVVEKMEKEEDVEFESLKLRVKLDRVDRLTAGGCVIIDYKTGKNNSIASWTDERITSAQLPLYAVVMHDIHAVCFAQVAVKKQQFLGMGKERGLLAGLKGPANDAESWEEQLTTWKENLAAIAAEIRQGYASVTPTSSACQFCELPALCRVDSTVLDTEEPAPWVESAS